MIVEPNELPVLRGALVAQVNNEIVRHVQVTKGFKFNNEKMSEEKSWENFLHHFEKVIKIIQKIDKELEADLDPMDHFNHYFHIAWENI